MKRFHRSNTLANAHTTKAALADRDKFAWINGGNYSFACTVRATLMSTEMTASNDEDDGDAVTRTTIEVDDAVWRRVRSEAIRADRKVSEQLEVILRDHFEIDDEDDQ